VTSLFLRNHKVRRRANIGSQRTEVQTLFAPYQMNMNYTVCPSYLVPDHDSFIVYKANMRRLQHDTRRSGIDKIGNTI